MEYTGLEKFDQLQEKTQEGRFSLKKFLFLHGISFGVENDRQYTRKSYTISVFNGEDQVTKNINLKQNTAGTEDFPQGRFLKA